MVTIIAMKELAELISMYRIIDRIEVENQSIGRPLQRPQSNEHIDQRVMDQFNIGGNLFIARAFVGSGRCELQPIKRTFPSQ